MVYGVVQWYIDRWYTLQWRAVDRVVNDVQCIEVDFLYSYEVQDSAVVYSIVVWSTCTMHHTVKRVGYVVTTCWLNTNSPFH